MRKLILFTATYLFFQTPSFSKIPFEQIHIHFDKSLYIAGDTIWFKAYVLADYIPSMQSRNFFIDLVDKNGKVIVAKQLPIIWGTSTGNMILPVSLPQDVYMVRGYTFNQLKKNEKGFFKAIPVINPSIDGSAGPGTINKTSNQKNPLPGNVTLEIEDYPKGKFFTITKKEGFNSSSLTLNGYMFGEMVFTQPLNNKTNTINGLIPVKDLPSGILYLKLLDNNQSLVAEKTTFVNNREFLLPVELKIDTIGFNAKEKNVLSFNFPDSIAGSFSLSITDTDKEPVSITNNNILSAFLIPSFEQIPVEYFLSKDSANSLDKKLEAVQTEGLMEKTDTVITDEPYIQIKGKALSNNKPLKQGEINFLVQTKDSLSTLISVPVQKNGDVVLDNMIFEDTATIFYQMNNNRPLDLVIDKTNPLAINIPSFMPQYLLSDFDRSVFNDPVIQQRSKYIYDAHLDTSKGKVLEEVVVTTRKQSPTAIVNKKYTSGVFSNSSMAKTFDFINDPPASFGGNVFDWLQGRLAGLRITRGRGLEYELTSPRSPTITGGTITAKIFLNEVEQIGTSMVATIPMSEIALVKYFTPGYMAMPGVGLSPVLAIYTKKYDDRAVQKQNFIQKFKFPGYSVNNEFTPYSDSDILQTATGATLIWKPDIIIEGSKSYTIGFINTKPVNSYHVTFEGFTIDGKLVHVEQTIRR